MNSAEVIERVRDHLQDQEGDIAETGTVTRWVRAAFSDVVLLVDEAPVPMNIIGGPGQTPTVVTWATTVREVALPVATYARVISVCPLGSDGVRERAPYSKVSFARRNTETHGVYIYRGFLESGGPAQWFIGQVPQVRSGAISANVYYRLAVLGDRAGRRQRGGVLVLEITEEELAVVPEEFHELIAIRAALLIKGVENRDKGDLVALWLEGKEKLGRFGVDRAHQSSWKY